MYIGWVSRCMTLNICQSLVMGPAFNGSLIYSIIQKRIKHKLRYSIVDLLSFRYPAESVIDCSATSARKQARV